MSDVRELLSRAAPLDDRGFLTAAEVRHEGSRRARRRGALAVAVVLLVLLALPALAQWTARGALPPADPAPPTSVEALARTIWYVRYDAADLLDDPRVVHLANGMSLRTFVMLDPDGRVRAGSAYRLFSAMPAGTWTSDGSSERLVPGRRGELRIDLEFLPATFDQNPWCTRESCPENGLAYWPGTLALERLDDVARYEVVPAGGPHPFGNGLLDVRLLDASGRVLLVLQQGDYDTALDLLALEE